MTRRFHDVVSIGFLLVATVAGILAIQRGVVPEAWVLVSAPWLIFSIATVLQFQPVASRNFAARVAPENLPRLDAAVRDFLAQCKANILAAIAFVAVYVLHPGSPELLLLVVGAVVVVTIAMVANLYRTVAQLA